MFDGPEDYHHRIDDPSLEIDEHTILIMRGAGPIGYPGAAEVVNMQPPGALIKRGVLSLPCIGDGRQSGTSGTPSILNASPEAAAGGGLALLQTGDRVRIDLNKRHGRYFDLAGGARAPPRRSRGPRRLCLPGEPDALAGDPAQHGGPALRGYGAETGGEVPEGGADVRRAARQSLRPTIGAGPGIRAGSSPLSALEHPRTDW